jgi:hypothetical protein
VGRKIIDTCLSGADVAEYARLIPHPFIDEEESV